MRKVQRSEIIDHMTYSERRGQMFEEIAAIKAPRRVYVGEYLTFLFENTETVRYQIQEMIRVEQIVKEEQIQYEIDTYNELLPGSGKLGCTLLIEIEDPGERDRLLREWVDLPRHIYARLDDGSRVSALFDARQVSDERLSSVQYITFDTDGRSPVAMGSSLPALTCETQLSEAQRAALLSDLS